MSTENIIGTTKSLCPECFKRIPAMKISHGDEVYLVKACPEHGEFRVKIWQGQPDYASWDKKKIPSAPTACATSVDLGCPFDCGLCPDHRQQTCCVLLEVTQGCNLHCPVCYATAENEAEADPDLNEIESWYRMLLASGGPYNIQLSGGEPTLRNDLPAIIKMGREMGFDFMQLNTNGLRLAKEPDLVKQLKDAGLSCVFLQFDGTTDEINKQIRGTALLDIKLAAIEKCAEQGIGVVLVPTLVPGVNTDDIGNIIDFAITRMPAVRGVHFQPISYFGRHPQPSARITIPEVLQAIEKQTFGKLKVDNFLPPGGENAYCSFHGNFILMPDGELKPWSSWQANKSTASQCCCTPITAAEGSKNAREFVARQWAAAQPDQIIKFNQGGAEEDGCCSSGIKIDSLDQFLERVDRYTLSISGMAFQDAWTLDLERLKDCLIHVVSPDKKLIPFCAYNLTANNGNRLYRN